MSLLRPFAKGQAFPEDDDAERLAGVYAPLLNGLMEMTNYALFNDPVDETIYNYIAINHPMCLRHVLDKVSTLEYCERHSIESDIKLIWDNAKQYNGNDHPIAIIATRCGDMIDRLCISHLLR